MRCGKWTGLVHLRLHQHLAEEPVLVLDLLRLRLLTPHRVVRGFSDISGTWSALSRQKLLLGTPQPSDRLISRLTLLTSYVIGRPLHLAGWTSLGMGPLFVTAALLFTASSSGPSRVFFKLLPFLLQPAFPAFDVLICLLPSPHVSLLGTLLCVLSPKPAPLSHLDSFPHLPT